ncbi:hypothetical protein Syun_021655 [Stephania yunnanensis]|uniref:Cytochrome P450 n=1 Tax=Stephania yunnanensis TaxID=152371 RepID=A0AAP0IH07_9MAGN
MVIKEILRLHPGAPILIPRESTEDVVINEYCIPKKSRVLVNIWAVERDPNVWSEDAEEFNPDRFIDLDIDIHGRYVQLIPFGLAPITLGRSVPTVQDTITAPTVLTRPVIDEGVLVQVERVPPTPDT